LGRISSGIPANTFSYLAFLHDLQADAEIVPIIRPRPLPHPSLFTVQSLLTMVSKSVVK
jgi:hypothetical protein